MNNSNIKQISIEGYHDKLRVVVSDDRLKPNKCVLFTMSDELQQLFEKEFEVAIDKKIRGNGRAEHNKL